MNDERVFRTDPATPHLLIIKIYMCLSQNSFSVISFKCLEISRLRHYLENVLSAEENVLKNIENNTV